MNHKYKLEDLTMNVNDAVRLYICIHNDVLRDTAHLGNLTKTPTDQDVTLSELFELCESLLLLWNDIRRNANEYRDSTYASLCLDEKSYFDALTRYVDSVRDSVAALVARQRLINKHGDAMKSKSFREKEKEYQDAIQHYKSIGEELHSLGSFFLEPETEDETISQSMCEVHQTRLRRANVRFLYGRPCSMTSLKR